LLAEARKLRKLESEALYVEAGRVRGEGHEIVTVRGEHGSGMFGEDDDERVYGRALSSETTKVPKGIGDAPIQSRRESGGR
jgi:hypothetical protein